MKENSLMRREDLVDNPTARIAVCLCLDTSWSMKGRPMEELNEGIRLFYEAIKEDEVALYAAEVCVITFGGKERCIVDFSSLNLQPTTPVLWPEGDTPMGEAVNLAFDLLEQRKNDYKSKGVDYYQPWLVLMSDGAPNGDEQELRKAISRTVSQVNSKKLTVFPIGIGEHADMDTLAKFSPNRQPLRLQGLKFKEFFAWLSKSMSNTSRSTPGDSVPLDFEGIKGWGEL